MKRRRGKPLLNLIFMRVVCTSPPHNRLFRHTEIRKHGFICPAEIAEMTEIVKLRFTDFVHIKYYDLRSNRVLTDGSLPSIPPLSQVLLQLLFECA